VLIFQLLEDLSDRQAADAVRVGFPGHRCWACPWMIRAFIPPF
jgi:hypothetical protein